MKRRVDLHMHSSLSDGAVSPDEVLAAALAGGLDVMALTDHDLPPPLPIGIHEVNGQQIRVIAGTEVSGSHADREFHLLVYFPAEMPTHFAEWLQERVRWRAQRFDQAAIALGLEARAHAEALAGQHSLTRHHLAKIMYKSGKVTNFHDAFKMMSPVMERLTLPYVEVIRRACEAGGVPVWAHPVLEDAKRYLPDFVRAGIVGIEVERPLISSQQRHGLKALASRFRLIATGGSDWHGWRDLPLGNFAASPEYAEPLLSRLGL